MGLYYTRYRAYPGKRGSARVHFFFQVSVCARRRVFFKKNSKLTANHKRRSTAVRVFTFPRRFHASLRATPQHRYCLDRTTLFRRRSCRAPKPRSARARARWTGRCLSSAARPRVPGPRRTASCRRPWAGPIGC